MILEVEEGKMGDNKTIKTMILKSSRKRLPRDKALKRMNHLKSKEMLMKIMPPHNLIYCKLRIFRLLTILGMSSMILMNLKSKPWNKIERIICFSKQNNIQNK